MANDSRYRDLIILRSVFGKVEMRYYLQPAKDPRTGRFPECVKFVDSKGDLILTDEERNSGRIWIGENQTIVVTDGTTFDLSDPYDRAKWEAIEHSPVIAPSRNAKDRQGHFLIDGDTSRKGDYKSVYSAKFGVAELYVERPDEEVQKKVSKKKLQHKAISFIVDDPRGSAGRALKARLLGRNMKNAPDADIEDYLIGVAEKDPELIINLYTEEDSGLRLLFIEAREKGVIYVKNKLYLFGEGTVLGATDTAAIHWMRDPKNVRIVDLIRKETNPDLYKDPEPDYRPALQDPQPTTYNSNNGDENPTKIPEEKIPTVEISVKNSKKK